MTQKYDVVIVGAGGGGLTSATGLARVGKKVLLIEREQLGGECTISGCIPSKALLHHARRYREAITIAGQTETSETYRQNAFGYVRAKVTEILTEETTEHFATLGIKVVLGEAVFTGKHTLSIGDETYSFKRAIIATRLSGRILGAHLISPRAGEIIGTVTLAMQHDISLYRLRATIFAYPTYSLILKKAGDYFLARQLSTLKNDLVYTAKKVAPKIIIILIWLFGLYQLYVYQQTYGLTATELSLRLFTAISETTYAPLLYILAYAVRPITFFPGTVFTILSGIFFGLPGIVYTIIGANLSASFAYFIGRFFSRENRTALGSRWSALLRENPFLAILTLRLTFFPFDAVNYGAGLLRVPFLPYFLATIIGTLRGIATFVTIGASLDVETFIKDGLTVSAIDTKFIVLSVLIFLTSLGIVKLLK